MQPEPTKTSIQSTKSVTKEHPTSTSQHGFNSPDLQPTDSLVEQRRVSAASSQSSGASHASIDYEGSAKEPFLGLNVEVSRDDRTRPSVHRISEHENAQASLAQKKEFEGLYFRVAKAGVALNGPRLESCPNGTSVLKYLIEAVR